MSKAPILLAEDEAMLRVIAVEMLEEAGFTVFEAGDGVEALDLLKAHPEIALLVDSRGKAVDPAGAGLTRDEVALIRGYREAPFTAGLMLTIIPIALGAVAPFSAAASDTRPRLVMLSGTACMAVSTLLLTQMLTGSPGSIAGAFVHERHAQSALPRFAGWWGHREDRVVAVLCASRATRTLQLHRTELGHGKQSHRAK